MAAKPIKTNSEIASSKQMSVAFMQRGGKRLPEIHIFGLITVKPRTGARGSDSCFSELQLYIL